MREGYSSLQMQYKKDAVCETPNEALSHSDSILIKANLNPK